ncbi:MAG: potassium channel family protein [Woeseiaceae bacterium]
MEYLPYWVIITGTVFAVVASVILHYEGLRFLSDKLPMPSHYHRRRIVLLILCLMLLHIIEIWIFGASYYFLQSVPGYGALNGDSILSIFDCVYYSATVFTTLGFGDIVPTGPIRFMTGVEAVSGLTFITWSASYTLMEMLRTQSAYDVD